MPTAIEVLLPDADLRAWLAATLPAPPLRAHRLQSLWRGYGELLRLELDGGHAPVILKRIAPPSAPTAPAAAVTAHRRKLRSYEVERRFYQQRSVTPQGARTARLLAVRAADDVVLLLEDLVAAGFAARHRLPDDDALRACLDWLADFHAEHLGAPAAAAGLWPTGCYWHLATRQDELQTMRDEPLRRAAATLDAALETCTFRTWVHGDAKPANFCFGAAGAAAVDFQYVGGGPGTRDVAYLLCCSRDDATCATDAEHHLSHYFARLRRRLPTTVDGAALEREWRALYPVAWADLQRFFDGWQPGCLPITDYTRHMLERALSGRGPG